MLAGVSTGTVDRFLHNRGDISDESRRKIEKVLTEINYNYNQYPSIAKTDKVYKLLVILPQYTNGDYWDSIAKGVEKTVYTTNSAFLKTKFLYYDQFDLYSCRQIFHDALLIKADAVIIGPSFYDETVLFANQLFLKDIPYIFVDTWVNNTKPLAFFGPHAQQTGLVQARLLTTVLDKSKDIAFFQAKRIGDETSIQSLTRSYGFMTYLKDHLPAINIYSAQYDNTNDSENYALLDKFFEEHPNIGGTVVFDTKAYLISNYLKDRNIKDIKLIGYGTSKKNIEGLKNDNISFLISERPEYQGQIAVRRVIDYLLHNKIGEIKNYTPIDILIKETIDFYTTD